MEDITFPLCKTYKLPKYFLVSKQEVIICFKPTCCIVSQIIIYLKEKIWFLDLFVPITEGCFLDALKEGKKINTQTTFSNVKF